MTDVATTPAATTATTTTTEAKPAAASSLVTAPTAETTTQAAAKTTEAKTETKATEATKAPEKYDLKLPEGTLLDEHAIEKTAAYAKAQGLSNEQAQALLERESGAISEYVGAQEAALESKAARWVEEVKADKEIGGAEFGKNVELAKRVIARYASPELKKVLNETGLGNHPELVRMMVKIGKASAEDTLVVPSAKTASTPKTAAEVLFPMDKLQEAAVPD